MDGDRPGRVLAGLGSFHAAGPASPTDPCQQVVELFHRVAVSVPAYRAFLREHGVEPGEVRTFADFERLPLMTKENYHRRYPLPDRCRQGTAGRLRHDRGVVRLYRAANVLAPFRYRRAGRGGAV